MGEEKNDIFLLLEEICKNAISVTISNEKEKLAEQECDKYLASEITNVYDMTPLSIYFIIKKLPLDEQIKFIKNNISYIKEHDEEIFIYDMESPKSLGYYLSLKVIKEIYKLDKNIFNKMINRKFYQIVNSFSEEDYLDFFTYFHDEIDKSKNSQFLNVIYQHNRFLYDQISIDKLVDIISKQEIYNNEFLNFIMKNYINKINQFEPQELLNFISYIEDLDVYKEFINKNYEKLNIAFSNISEYNLKEYLSETGEKKQEILISIFFENIIKKQDIKKIIYKISPNIIIDLYSKNKEIFNTLTLNDWVKLCSKFRVLNDSFKEVLDTFEIENIELLFDTEFYISYLNRQDVSALRYIETKYRNNIKTKGILEKIDVTTSIFSEKYLKNLSELKEMFKNNIISKNDECYKQHLSNFILFLKKQNIINSIENNNFKEIEKLFYRIVMGKSITILYELSSIEEITILNRLGKKDFNVKDFTVEQLENYNVKQHRRLYNKFKNDKWHIANYKKLILKLIFMVGYNNARVLLEIDDALPTLEHLTGNVDVKNVILDQHGNPILNTKLMNLLFNDKNYSKIKEMLSNKDNDLYKYFPRIFSEWEMIIMNDKDKSLKIIIDFLKSDEISLPPKYYRLEGLFKFIGCKNSIVNETLLLHDQILKRTFSTIPRIVGTKDEYYYEILELHDMESLSIGNKTDCCFTVLGNGYSCLKHSLTSNNGRILVIKKDNDVLAHSWVWRNGDLLCFDNIEISKTINCVDFLDIYLKVADELIKTSFEREGIKSCIKNVTIGFTNFDKEIKGIENYPCLISKTCDLKAKDFDIRLGNNRKYVDILPQPIEEVSYSDSKNVQYLIKGNGDFKLFQSSYTYQDERKEVLYYNCINDKTNIEKINKMINALRQIKYEEEGNFENFRLINIEDFEEVYCNEDWYIIINKQGEKECYIQSNDSRSEQEYCAVNEKYQIKKLIKCY